MNMNKHRKHRAFGLLASLSVALVATLPISAQAQSQDYPNKPVKLIVPYPPGGATDIGARVVAQKLTEQTGQAFVVENRAGAGGNLGAEAAAQSAASLAQGVEHEPPVRIGEDLHDLRLKQGGEHVAVQRLDRMLFWSRRRTLYRVRGARESSVHSAK